MLAFRNACSASLFVAVMVVFGPAMCVSIFTSNSGMSLMVQRPVILKHLVMSFWCFLSLNMCVLNPNFSLNSAVSTTNVKGSG